jgi:hypothetical protein
MIIDKSIVFKAEKGTNRQSCAFPGVGVLPNGRWLGSCRAAPTKGGVDHSEPSLPFFNDETEGLFDSRIFLSESNDGGEKWSMPKLINTSPFNIPTPITGPILILPNGDWASHQCKMPGRRWANSQSACRQWRS